MPPEESGADAAQPIAEQIEMGAVRSNGTTLQLQVILFHSNTFS